VQSAVGEKSVQIGWTKGLGFCCMILKNQLIWFSRKKIINNKTFAAELINVQHHAGNVVVDLGLF